MGAYQKLKESTRQDLTFPSVEKTIIIEEADATTPFLIVLFSSPFVLSLALLYTIS